SVAFDVVVVNSSVDKTGAIVKEQFPSVRLIEAEKRLFAGAARNVGVRATRSAFCLMLDSDCVARSDLIDRMMARHREGEYAAVGGSLGNGTPNSLSGWIGYLIEFKEFMPSTPLRLEKMIPTANICYRRDVFERLGLFAEDMWPAEDLLFNWRIYNSGERLLFDPSIQVTHLNRTGWREVLSYQVRLGRLSAVARRRGGLPGGLLLQYPILITLMPFVRSMRAAQWLIAYDKRALMVFLLTLPLYLLAATFWSVGFFQGATSEE
ncbi:MAG TPA: glycosyltransferase, partial [Blastocatellia bacterium]|nr:glycosyltransferase [Blastocatellia bacterium]